MKVHFIAIGGSAMHNLAIALHKKGYHVTGSDDEIFEPSKSRLQQYGLLPNEIGWNESNITNQLDAVILGMHARADNPELLKAQQLGVKIFSYPEFLYEQSKNKTRLVIGGSHGKTTITAMILHVLKTLHIDADYMVGAQLEGFDVMVKLSESAPIMVLEGDEYLTSPIDRRPKFHLYRPHIALINGIAWDHINVFPEFDMYVAQFEKFIEVVEENGSLLYNATDEIVVKIALQSQKNIKKIAYHIPQYVIENGITNIIHENKKYSLQIFGEHNLVNLEGARKACQCLGVADADFFCAIQSFKGASKRLELVAKNKHCSIYKDFAHAPSKLKATIKAVKSQYPERKLIACIELHTFSSLNQKFLPQYANTTADADVALVYFNPKAIEHKKLPMLSKAEVRDAFAADHVQVFNDASEIVNYLKQQEWTNTNLLLMSSGNFDGVDYQKLATDLLK